MIGTPNPDPLRPAGTDELYPTAEYVAGYDHGYEDAAHGRLLLQATAFGLGVAIGSFLAALMFVVGRG